MKEKEPQMNDLMTLAEAADLIAASVEVMRRAADCGELPARKFRRVWVTTRSAVLEWDAHRIKKRRAT